MQERIKVGLNLMNHLIFAQKAYIPNFIPLVPVPHVKKFVVGGWVGVESGFYCYALSPSLTINAYQPS